MIISEHELRANWHKTKLNTITIPQGSIITPSARDFLRSQGIQLEFEGKTVLNQTTQAVTDKQQDTDLTGEASDKAEHMTHLRGKELVLKTHPAIAWRGQLDQFDCLLVETQAMLIQNGERNLAEKLEEVAVLAQKLMAAEVREQPITFGTVLGWTAEQVREMSHYPDKYFGIQHTTMNFRDGWLIARLNCLRAKIREVELYANHAFTDKDGFCSRPDIIFILNRLSSLFYVLICGQRSRLRDVKCLPIGISNRHIHLSSQHMELLFGSGHSLQKRKDLSQPGQFAAEELLTLVGSKGQMEKVRVLGPVRTQTQVEVSVTDCFQLGLKPMVRDSGQLEGTSGVTLIGPEGSVDLKKGVIVAARHIHIHSDQAKEWQLQDGQRVSVQIESERPAILQDVLIRVSPNFTGELHLDTDEANAAFVKSDTKCLLGEV